MIIVATMIFILITIINIHISNHDNALYNLQMKGQTVKPIASFGGRATYTFALAYF